jgi:hypothetical protein
MSYARDEEEATAHNTARTRHLCRVLFPLMEGRAAVHTSCSCDAEDRCLVYLWCEQCAYGRRFGRASTSAQITQSIASRVASFVGALPRSLLSLAVISIALARAARSEALLPLRSAYSLLPQPQPIEPSLS